MDPNAFRGFKQWEQRYAGQILIIPHHSSPSGKILKCPDCGSAEDFVLYTYKGQENSDKIRMRCFNPSPHLIGREDYSDKETLAEFLREGEQYIPFEDYLASSGLPVPQKGLEFVCLFSLVMCGCGLSTYYILIAKQLWIGVGLIVGLNIVLVSWVLISFWLKPLSPVGLLAGMIAPVLFISSIYYILIAQQEWIGFGLMLAGWVFAILSYALIQRAAQ